MKRKKRISRRELIEKTKTLERRRLTLESELADAEEQRDKYAKRLEYLGSEGWKQLDITRIEVKPEPWGGYIEYGDKDVYTQIDIDAIKMRLAEKLVRGLMEAGYVQIIVKDRDYFFGRGVTIGAKIFVVPWEKTVIGRVC